MRHAFDVRFEDPRSARADRFVWDYWHVPGQYTALRTPAWTYFPRPLYEAFHQRLVAWGRETLGCHDVSPPWLSNYIEGCRQELHGDDGEHNPRGEIQHMTSQSSHRGPVGSSRRACDRDTHRHQREQQGNAKDRRHASISTSPKRP